MSRFMSVLHITNELDEVLSQNISVTNREQVVERINELVEKRGKLLQQITPPYTEKEKQTGKEVIALNENVQKKMDRAFAELKQEIQQINKQKKSSSTYENSYDTIQTIDGMFVDQKK